MLLLWKLWDLLLQIVVKIFVVILYKIYYYDKIQMWYFTYWVLSIIIKFLCMLAGRSAVDIWWWLFEGEVFSVWSLPWWQWHLNGSRLRFLFFLLWRSGPTRANASSFLRFLDHTQRRITVGRTPLDEWSARRRDLYLTTHNTHNRQTSMPRWDSNSRSQQASGRRSTP